VLPMQRGQVPPELLLGLDRPAGAASHRPRGETSHDHQDVHDHDHDPHDHHDHGHHDHTHVPMKSVAIQLDGSFDREALEATLLEQIQLQALLRLKGWLLQPGKRRPLQIQAVGPRLDCWYEDHSDRLAALTAIDRGSPFSPSVGRLELVALGLRIDRSLLLQALESTRLREASASRV
jgi:cobalamin biosynthesis protein CobW